MEERVEQATRPRGNPRALVLCELLMLRVQRGERKMIHNVAKENGFRSGADLVRRLWDYYRKNPSEMTKKLQEIKKRPTRKKRLKLKRPEDVTRSTRPTDF